MRSDGGSLKARSVLVALVLGLIVVPAAAVSPAPVGGQEGDAFQPVWARTDLPVAESVVHRTWMWGPEPFTDVLVEPYGEAPDGSRQVVYYDKSRMEITSPEADPWNPWYVTNGLLAVELITGRMQLGHDEFEQRLPSEMNVAGDQGFDNGPSYATFGRITGQYGGPGNNRTGETVTHVLERSGRTDFDLDLETYGIELVHHDEVTRFNIAGPFWEFMNASGTVWKDGEYVEEMLFPDPFYATGRPISAPYWSRIVVGGSERDVLIQCFERRCLTYTPDNPEGWQVEVGNIGRHYYEWRYAERPQIGGELLFQKEERDAVHGGFTSEIYVSDASGESMTNLTEDIHGHASGAIWSPDGSRILFVVSQAYFGPGELYAINADGTGLRQLASGVVLGSPVWSADGTQIAFVEQQHEDEWRGGLFVVDVETSELTRITDGPDAAPVWSPDDSLIAFERRLSDDEVQLFLIDPDGQNERQLTDIPIPDEAPYDRVSLSGSPVWSPDGSRIAFTSLTGSTVPPPVVIDVMVIDVDGTGLTELASTPVAHNPVWSPDGNWIAFDEPQEGDHDLPGSAVWFVNLATGETTEVGDDYTDPSDPAWSPDGSRVAVSGRIMAQDGTTLRWVSAIGDGPAWSSNGNYIASRVDQGIAITAADGSSGWLLGQDGWNVSWRPMGT